MPGEFLQKFPLMPDELAWGGQLNLEEFLQKFPLVPGVSLQGFSLVFDEFLRRFSLVLGEAALELLWMVGEVPREVAVGAGGGLGEGGCTGYYRNSA